MDQLFDPQSDIDDLQFLANPRWNQFSTEEKRILFSILHHSWELRTSSPTVKNSLQIDDARQIGHKGASGIVFQLKIKGVRNLIMKVMDEEYMKSPLARLWTFREIITLILNQDSDHLMSGFGSRLLMNHFPGVPGTAGKLVLFMNQAVGDSFEFFSQSNSKRHLIENIEALVAISQQLHLLHHRGLIHRDIKPENIIVAPDDPKKIAIIDFGTVIHTGEKIKANGRLVCKIDDFHNSNRTRLIEGDMLLNSPLSLTQKSQLRFPGTPAYMSPEHYGMEAVEGADVWALGIMLLELLSKKAKILRILVPNPAIRIDPQIHALIHKTQAESIQGSNYLIKRAVSQFPDLSQEFQRHAFWEYFLEQVLNPNPNMRPSAGVFSEIIALYSLTCLGDDDKEEMSFARYLRSKPMNLQEPEQGISMMSPRKENSLKKLFSRNYKEIRDFDQNGRGEECYRRILSLSNKIQNSFS